MTVESGTYISDFNASNPGGSDPKSEGDDHIRLIKAWIKATFPNITGAVTATHTALNNAGTVASTGTFPTVAVTGVTDLTTTGNTILGDASTDTLNVGNGGIVKDASGNVGIGMTPSQIVDVTKTQNATSAVQILNASTGTTAAAGFKAVNSVGTNLFELLMTSTGYTFNTTAGASCGFLHADGAGGIYFAAGHASGTIRFGAGAASEQMRLDTSGNLLINRAASSWSPAFTGNAGAVVAAAGSFIAENATVGLQLNRITTDGAVAQFYRAAVQVGSISVTGSATAYNTSSDVRLKTNIVPMASKGSLIDAIQPRNFEFKAEPGKVCDGFIAQELNEVVPAAVTRGEMWSVDYSKLVPLLVKEVQELRLRVAALEA